MKIIEVIPQTIGLREFKLRKTIAPIIEMNSSRNTVAHSLSPLDSDAVKQLGIAMKTLKTLVREQYHLARVILIFIRI